MRDKGSWAFKRLSGKALAKERREMFENAIKPRIRAVVLAFLKNTNAHLERRLESELDGARTIGYEKQARRYISDLKISYYNGKKNGGAK